MHALPERYSECMNHGDFFCALNEISREREIYYRCLRAEAESPRHRRRHSGMQAALTAERNGHEVILCEKSGELGGGILCERDVPFKERLHQYIEQQKYFISKSAIDLRLNTEVTPEYAAAEKPDVIIAAVGADPIVPKIPGVCGANVYQAIDVYKDPSLAKGKVVILGAGFVGVELALYLMDLGNKDIEIVEMLDDISDGGNDHHRTPSGHGPAEEASIHFPKAVEITDKGVRCEGRTARCSTGGHGHPRGRNAPARSGAVL